MHLREVVRAKALPHQGRVEARPAVAAQVRLIPGEGVANVAVKGCGLLQRRRKGRPLGRNQRLLQQRLIRGFHLQLHHPAGHGDGGNRRPSVLNAAVPPRAAA